MLAILGGLVGLVGVIMALVGGIQLLIEAFKEHILWGLAVFFTGIGGLIFTVMHWDRAGRPFLLNLAGCFVAFAGGFLMAMGG